MFVKKILGSRYLLVKQLGQGSFGKTYLAKDLMLPGDPECVVKQLHPHFQDEQTLTIARRLFASEAEALQKLGDRQRIPQLLAYFEEKEQFYLVMQYIAGNALSKELAPGSPWPEAKVIKLLKNCLDILDYIHSRGVIHRDIKPGNLICRQEDNKLILVDFGAVKEVLLARGTALADQPTVGIGTRGYMPEEQAIGKPRFNSDIYAVGVIGIQAITGCNPLQLDEDRKGEFIWQHKAQVSSQLAEILTKMTRCNWEKRYQLAKEIITDLDLFDGTCWVDRPNNTSTQTTSTIVFDCDRNDNLTLGNLSSTVIGEDSSSKNDTALCPEKIQFCRQELANYVGPLSTFIIDDILSENPQIELSQLVERLAAEIPDSDRAKEFTTALSKLSSENDQKNAPVSAEEIDKVTQELADYIGPLSTFIVRETLNENPQINLEQLIDSVAARIPNSEKAKEFTKKLTKLLSKTEKKNSSIDSKFIEFCRQELSDYVGPLSTFIIGDVLSENPQISLPQLVDRLAAEIPNSKEANKFKKNILSRI